MSDSNNPPADNAGDRTTDYAGWPVNRPTDPFANPTTEGFPNTTNGETANPPAAGARVIDLPHRTPDQPTAGGRQLVGAIVEGELLSEEENAALDRRLARKVAVHRRPQEVVKHSARVATRATARAAWQTGQGHLVWLRRASDALTHGATREQIRRSRAAGDHEALEGWMLRLEAAKAARRARVHDLPEMLRHLLITGVVGGVLFSAFLLVVGVGVWVSPGGWTWDEWWGFVGDIADAVGTAFMVALQVAVFSVVPMWVYLAWRFGRDAGLPTWAMAPDQRDEATSIVTPAGVAAALAHLNIAPLNKAIKNGWEVAFHTPPVRVNNRGYQVVFDLPMGVTAEMIADKRTVLARNLHRAEIEVWPAEAERAGFVDLWVADPGANSKSAPAYPLLNSGTADVFAGIPLGVSLRGDLISVALFAVNVVFGGLMGQGKSNAARVMMLGAAVDPLAELWVFVFAGNGDFDAYQPRLARYHRGTGDDVAAAALAALQELYVEVDRRERRLAELGAKKVTRGLVEMHPDLRPVVALFSECHELFGHEDFGKQAADFAVQTLRRARKTGITLAFDTQSSRADAIPPKIVELVQINACFAVKTWRSNDGFLGDGSFQAGIRATELRAGKDRGTSVLTGATAERFEIVKWHFIEVDDDTGFDAATDVIARAMTKVHPAVPVGGTTGAPAVQPAEVDHLADIADALQSEAKVRTQVVLARLAEADRGTYESWTFSDLAGELDKVGIGARKSNGVMFVFAQDVREAITDRDHDESEESGT